jgi:hypothetical protein
MAAVKAATKTTPISVIALLGAAVLVQLGCSKPTQPTKAERIAAIDAMLNAGPTGASGDADNRAALRAERAQLTGSAPSRPMATTARPAAAIVANAAPTGDRQAMVARLQAEADASRAARVQADQAQRDQWKQEDRDSRNKQNGDFTNRSFHYDNRGRRIYRSSNERMPTPEENQ